MPPLGTVNHLLALSTLVLQILTVAFLALFFLRARFPDLEDVALLLSRHGLWAAFVVSLFGSLVTIVHSSVYGLPPCTLCYWQRAFLYPQVFLFALALWRRDARIADYSILLSAVGLVIALYHHALQMFPAGSIPCPAGGTVSCAKILFLELGYITYPMMAVSLFAFLIVLMLFVRKAKD